MSEILQRTPEWFELRLGKVTASRIGDLMAKTRSGYSASRANYMTELAIQRLTGAVGQGFTSPAMQWGTEQESNARNAYSFFTENEVEEIAFINHPTIEQAGASPDGLVGDDGLVEIKCPNSATHLKIFIKRVERDDKLIAEITAEVKKFLAELDELMTQLKQKAEAA